MRKLLTFVVLMSSIVLVGCAHNANQSTNNAANSDNEQAAQVEDGTYTEFAQCLTENELTMYGTEWCPHCQNQKEMFGDAFAEIDYIDCDKNRTACVQAGIEGYPTWIDAQGNSYAGTRQLQQLGQIAGCELPS